MHSDSIAFALRPHHDGHGAVEVVPVIDGTPLTDRVHEFERDAGMETRAISYGGRELAVSRSALPATTGAGRPA